MVTWGKSEKAPSIVKRTADKQGTIAVGWKVMVTWGKSEKTHQAEVVSASGTQTPTTSLQDRRSIHISNGSSSSAALTHYVCYLSRRNALAC